jgi:hypothetical protein
MNSPPSDRVIILPRELGSTDDIFDGIDRKNGHLINTHGEVDGMDIIGLKPSL